LLCYDEHHDILTSFLIQILHAYFTAFGEKAKNYAVTDLLEFIRIILFQKKEIKILVSKNKVSKK